MRLSPVDNSRKLPAERVIGGLYPIRLTRRRYGSGTWFCWVHFLCDGAWRSLGDPWQKYRPADEEIKIAIEQTLRREVKND
jgi:hypothetical protein